MLKAAMRERVYRLLGSIVFIALIAMSLRTAYVIRQTRLIPAEVLATVPFQNEVGNVAAALADGRGFCCLFRRPTGPTAWLAPVYPLLLAALFKLFGTFTLASCYAAVLLNCVFSSLACIPIYYSGRRIGGPVAAALAAWIWAVFPSGIVMPFEWIWDTSLSVLLGAALLWATLRLRDSLGYREASLYGLLWGVSLLTNPALGSLLPFLFGWIFSRHVSTKTLDAARLLLAIGVMILVCVPWTLRNWIQFHRFIPLRSNFAYEFWSGNNEMFDEHSHAINRITRYEEVHLYSQDGETEFLHEKWLKAVNFVRTHPRLYFQLFGRRVIATWFGTETPWLDFLRTDSLFVRFVFLWNAVAVLGIVVGLLRLHLSHNPGFFPLAVFPLVFPVTFYIAHTTLRHRHPCDPVIALILALGIVGCGVRTASN
jgi:4-amino-4-deoxy-L-arabinose transferase-like glycosyltransferase